MNVDLDKESMHAESDRWHYETGYREHLELDDIEVGYLENCLNAADEGNSDFDGNYDEAVGCFAASVDGNGWVILDVETRANKKNQEVLEAWLQYTLYWDRNMEFC